MNEIRVLLVEGEPAEARFFQEAFAEMEEATRDGAWVHCRVTHVECAEDAGLVGRSERPDIVLFNTRLADATGMEAFYLLREACTGVPLVAVLERGDEGLGRRMLREGAQDYLMVSEVDCGLLARTIMNAVERQRFVRAATFCIDTDFDTGLPGREAFEAAGARDVALAGECGRTLWLLAAEIDNLEELTSACGRLAAHDSVLEAAVSLRNSAGERALVARVGPGRFAILDWEHSAEELIGAVQGRIQADHQEFAFVFGQTRLDPVSGMTIGGALAAAEAMLCENKLAYSDQP